MLAATSAAIAAAKAERDLLERRVGDLRQQPRASFRLRLNERKLEAVVAYLAALEASAKVEEAQLGQDDEAAIVVGLVLAADLGIAAEVRAVSKTLREMSPPELLAAVGATRAARAALGNADTVMGKCTRRDNDTALAIAEQIAGERGIAITPVPVARKNQSLDRGGQEI